MALMMMMTMTMMTMLLMMMMMTTMKMGMLPLIHTDDDDGDVYDDAGDGLCVSSLRRGHAAMLISPRYPKVSTGVHLKRPNDASIFELSPTTSGFSREPSTDFFLPLR